MREKISLYDLKKINYWVVSTDDGCEGRGTKWRYIAKGSPDNIIKQILNEGHKVGWGFKFQPLKFCDDFEQLDIININIVGDTKLNLELKIKRFELAFWYEAGLMERGDETFYHYQKDLFPSMQPYLQYIDWISSNGDKSHSPMRRPGTCEYKIPQGER